MDYTLTKHAIDRKDEIEKIQKTVAKESYNIGFDQSDKRNGVPTGMLMKSSIMKALEF